MMTHMLRASTEVISTPTLLLTFDHHDHLSFTFVLAPRSFLLGVLSSAAHEFAERADFNLIRINVQHANVAPGNAELIN